jgi:hypothetical protein
MKTTQTAAIEAAKHAFAIAKKSGDFTATKSGEVAKAALDAIVDKDGNPVEFTEDEKLAFLAPFNGMVANKVAVMKKVLDRHGIEADEVFTETLKQFFNPSAVDKKIKDAAKDKRVSVKDWIAAT